MLDYPVLSETFVQDEIAALRAQGAEVMTVSLQGGPGADVALGPLSARSPRVIGRALRLLARRPQAVGALVRGPLTPGLRLKLLAAAHEAFTRRVDVVHAHFAYRSADGAAVIGRALGLGHSLTAHARDIFVPDADLPARLTAARIVITVCEYNRRFLETEYQREVAGKLAVVPCSTDVSPPDCPPAPVEPTPVVLAVGRLVPKKGLDVLIEACAQMKQPAAVVVIGQGPEEERLVRLTKELGVESRVSFLGARSHQETRCAYRTATVFCLPCRVDSDGDRDSMPVVVKEAMAAGVPVVATEEVGVPEMVEDGGSGILVPPDDAAAVARALDELLGDPDRRRAMGARGKEIVAERFDLRDQARRLLELLT